MSLPSIGEVDYIASMSASRWKKGPKYPTGINQFSHTESTFEMTAKHSSNVKCSQRIVENGEVKGVRRPSLSQ